MTTLAVAARRRRWRRRGLFALATGAVALRTAGVNFIMITLAFGQMAIFVAASLAAYGGDDGCTLAAAQPLFGADAAEGRTCCTTSCSRLCWRAYLLLRAIVASRFGRVLRGDPARTRSRMQAIGFAPYRYPARGLRRSPA